MWLTKIRAKLRLPMSWSEKLRAQILPGSDQIGRDLGQHLGVLDFVGARPRA
jgi:hypothetical protein